MIYAFIPARSGSTRLNDKNFLDLKGKKLFEWSIEAANKAIKVDKIIFSTDSEKYVDYMKSVTLAKELIIDIRNEENSSSSKKIYDYLCNDFLKNNNFLEDDDLILMLLPTQPYRSLKDINNLIDLCLSSNTNVFSCREYDFPLSFAIEINEENNYTSLFSDSPLLTGNTRSQDQKTYFHPDGSIYIVSVNSLKRKYKSIYEKATPYIVNRKIYIDIDSKEDFDLALKYGSSVLTDSF